MNKSKASGNVINVINAVMGGGGGAAIGGGGAAIRGGGAAIGGGGVDGAVVVV